VVEHPDRADMWLTLEVYCPGQGVTHIVSNQKISTDIETYLFNWNIVSGNDSNEELKKALSDNFKIEWEDANISKSRGIINIYADNLSAEIVMDGKKEKATLKISDGQTYELKVKTEDGMLKIYYVRALVEWRAVRVFSQEDAIASVKANESPQYYIRYNDGYNNSLWGPYIGPTLTNSPPVLSVPNVFPLEGTYNNLFVYKVYVSDKDGDDVWVTLHINESRGNETYNETHVMSGIESKTGMTESWIYNFTEENVSKKLSFFFTATDGADYAKKVDGEDIAITPSRPEREQALPRGLSLLVIEALVVIVLALTIISLIRKYHKSILMCWHYIIRKKVIEEEIV
jgi:hypothetical protein